MKLAPMFSELHPAMGKNRTVVFAISHAFHLAVLVLLLHSPRPIFVSPRYVAKGETAGTTTYLYWPKGPFDNSAAATPQRTEKTRITWNKAHGSAKPKQNVSHAQSSDVGPNSAFNQTRQPTPTGSQYGSLLNGPLTGPEVRPALPVQSPDPVVDPAELPNGVEGSVVVEVTIDERGNIVRKIVLQSLGPSIDTKVLAVLENWHFLPATRYGVPIPSKQDVSYHFKPRT
jgi:TonB family protein